MVNTVRVDRAKMEESIVFHVTEPEMLYAQDVFMIQLLRTLNVLNVFQVQA